MIRIRAERKVGELLKEMATNGSAIPAKEEIANHGRPRRP
jgi:hypothetical protein